MGLQELMVLRMYQVLQVARVQQVQTALQELMVLRMYQVLQVQQVLQVLQETQEQ